MPALQLAHPAICLIHRAIRRQMHVRPTHTHAVRAREARISRLLSSSGCSRFFSYLRWFRADATNCCCFSRRVYFAFVASIFAPVPGCPSRYFSCVVTLHFIAGSFSRPPLATRERSYSGDHGKYQHFLHADSATYLSIQSRFSKMSMPADRCVVSNRALPAKFFARIKRFLIH